MFLCVDDADARRRCESLWDAVFSLFTALFKVSGPDTYASSVRVLVKHWQTVTGTLLRSNIYKNMVCAAAAAYDFYL